MIEFDRLFRTNYSRLKRRKRVRVEGEQIEIGCLAAWGEDDPRNNMWIIFHTREDTDSRMFYREKGTDSWLFLDAHQTNAYFMRKDFVQWFKMTNLIANTQYEVKMKNSPNVYTFTTMPDELSEVRIAGTSDITHHKPLHAGVFHENLGKGALTEFDPHAIIFAGDIVHDNGERVGDYIVFWDAWFKYGYRKNGDMIPIITILGNHDGIRRQEDGTPFSLLWGGTYDDAHFFKCFYPFPGEVGYNKIDISDYLTIVALNTGHTASIRGEQKDWLQQTLESRQDGRFILPAMHVPPYPGYYSYTDYWSGLIRTHWTPLLTKYSVDFAFTGHNHTFTTSPRMTGENLDMNGVHYVGQGAGFATIIRGGKSTDEFYIDAYDGDPTTARGFCGFVITSEKAYYRRINVDGQQVYEIEINR